jgi:D-beta-D-heptose 7-phosphate kinase/D-beta-D-heptose 1-phosphate adenosyltransferase
MLAFARAQGDVLFVGLNSDEGVRRLKGSGRPVHGEGDRVEVLSALASVDQVVVFPEDDPVALVRALRPDVIVKGEDWRDRGVLGADLVESWGGRVAFAPLLPGRSSTGALARMSEGGPAAPAERAPARKPSAARTSRRRRS